MLSITSPLGGRVKRYWDISQDAKVLLHSIVFCSKEEKNNFNSLTFTFLESQKYMLYMSFMDKNDPTFSYSSMTNTISLEVSSLCKTDTESS